MKRKYIYEYLLFMCVGIVGVFIGLIGFNNEAFVNLQKPIGNSDVAGYILLAGSVLFCITFIWVRKATQSWQQAKGLFVDRKRAFMSRIDGPLVKYNDAGKYKIVEVQRAAAYLKEPLRLRISPKGVAIAEGPEYLLVALGLLTFLVSLFILVN